jgi:hypothetical protein
MPARKQIARTSTNSRVLYDKDENTILFTNCSAHKGDEDGRFRAASVDQMRVAAKRFMERVDNQPVGRFYNCYQVNGRWVFETHKPATTEVVINE